MLKSEEIVTCYMCGEFSYQANDYENQQIVRSQLGEVKLRTRGFNIQTQKKKLILEKIGDNFKVDTQTVIEH